MSGLKQTRNTAREGQLDAAEAALRIPSPRQRLDLGLGSVVAGLLALGGVAGFGLAAWSVASGWFDPPLLVEISDPRILNDYRDNPAPMVDLVTAGDDLLIGRKDGSVDVFDMTSRRFSAESLPRGGLLTGDLSLLATDCTTPVCAEGGSSYALTAQGGLAQRRGRDWLLLAQRAAPSSKPMCAAGRPRMTAHWCWSMPKRRVWVCLISAMAVGSAARP